MTMLDIFKETAKELPVELNILSIKESNTKDKIRVEHGGTETTVELYKTCAPGEERNYCWYAITTAMSAIYLSNGDIHKARLWMDAMHDKSLVTAGNASNSVLY